MINVRRPSIREYVFDIKASSDNTALMPAAKLDDFPEQVLVLTGCQPQAHNHKVLEL
jgi:hypothetical protein